MPHITPYEPTQTELHQCSVGTCLVDGCPRYATKRGLCATCYERASYWMRKAGHFMHGLELSNAQLAVFVQEKRRKDVE